MRNLLLATVAMLCIAAMPALAQSPELGAVTTTAPSYTSGTNRAFSLDTSGGLRTTGTGLGNQPAPNTGTFTDRSGAVTLGGTSQQLAAANTSRKRIIIENPCTATSQNIPTAESLFINFTTAAAANLTSVELAPCGSFDTGAGPVTTEVVNVIGATTAHKWVAKEM